MNFNVPATSFPNDKALCIRPCSNRLGGGRGRPEKEQGLQAPCATQISLPDRRKLGPSPDLPPLATESSTLGCACRLQKSPGLDSSLEASQPWGGREVQSIELGAGAGTADAFSLSQNFIGGQHSDFKNFACLPSCKSNTCFNKNTTKEDISGSSTTTAKLY